MLRDEVVVVTGGGRGLGRVTAVALADAGAAVVVCGRDRDALDGTVEEIRSAGGTADAVVADVTAVDDLVALRDATIDRHGRVDVLVNNSGIAGPSAPLWELDPDDWDATFAVNVRGVFLACRAFLPDMIAAGRGSIVTIGSMTGKRPLPGRTPYAASKTALIGLTRTLAHDAGRYGIRVNLVSPGAIEGERIERVIANLAVHEGIAPDEARERFTGASPLARLVPPEDVAATVVFLASDRAASITGDDINVSAGVTMD